MAKQKIVWTALPYGRVTRKEDPLVGRLRVSIVVSPRLTPETAGERILGAKGFADFHDWPKTLASAAFQLRIGGIKDPLSLEVISKVQPDLWSVFFPMETRVDGFVFKDMSQVNLRSYAVRNVLGFLRKHYGNLATQAADAHPILLPWKDAHGVLKGMLTDLGTRTEQHVIGDRLRIETMLPGFDRFFDDANRGSVEKLMQDFVFGQGSLYRSPVVDVDGQPSRLTAPVRALLPDWQDPAGGGSDADLMSRFITGDEYTFYQANRFYRRTVPTADQKKLLRPNFKNVPVAPEEPDFDFHQIVASLADYPHVLRALGLIIDCALPADNAVLKALGSSASADGTLGVEVEWKNHHDTIADIYPSTAWRVTTTRFVTRARTGDHTDGLLSLTGTADPTLIYPDATRSDFDIFQVDPDGAGLKTTNYLLTAQNLIRKSLKPGTHGEVTYTTGDRQPVAALRSGGLGVSRHGRAIQVALTAAATKLKNDVLNKTPAEFISKPRKVVLFIEDVLRGYRVDVLYRDHWFSLCMREGRYELVNANKELPFDVDEGYVKGASTTSDGSDDHYLHESLFRWTGWSLAVPRPGNAICAVKADKSELQGETVEDVQETAKKGNGLAVRFHAPAGTLPRLRFGEDYRFRARIVDLAGNSLAFDDASLGPLEQATEVVTYLRYEPVDPPALLHRHRVSEGESLERMVIRSNFDRSPADYLVEFMKAFPQVTSPDFEYVEKNERHVVPPKSAQVQCEQHAMFDTAFGRGTPAAIMTAYETAAREGGTLYDPLPGAKIELVTPATVQAVAQTEAVPPAMPASDNPTAERLVGGQYVLHREDRVETPYLPDAAAGGFALRGETPEDFARIGITQPMRLRGPGAEVLRGHNKELVLIVKYTDGWPKTKGLRIVLNERQHELDDGTCKESLLNDGCPEWDPEQGVLNLFLRKGHIARLRYASCIDDRFIRHFGLPYWSSTAQEHLFIARMALLGMHWMLTPYRPLVLVHATQQPVCTPKLKNVQVSREVGSTYADLDAAVQLHGPSTGKFEVVAHWQEWVDDVKHLRPQRLDMEARLTEIPLPENGPNNMSLTAVADATQPPPGNAAVNPAQRAKGNRHDFGDTKFRLVRYQLEATTRFREYLPEALYTQQSLVTRTGPEALETQALLGSVSDLGAPVLFNVSGATANGAQVPNTAAPDVPRIIYVVPTFRWARELGAARITQSSTRFGNGLRVYLERPWFSSGDGEMLGVVLPAQRAPAMAESSNSRISEIMMRPYVTQWGLDPLFDSAKPKENVQASAFTARICSETLQLQEATDSGSVEVVGHRVQWDDERKLWYCDIEIDAGVSYMPFVRLALVRYQPHSLPSVKVSRVAMADFAQLLPRRHATVARMDQTVRVSVHGTMPIQGPMLFSNDSAYRKTSPPLLHGGTPESGRNKIELVLQTRDPNIDSDLAWSDVTTLASGLALSPGAKIANTVGIAPLSPLFEQPASPPPTLAEKAGTPGIPHSFQAEVLLPTEDAVVGSLFDPAVWQATVTLPATDNRPTRLVLREFERYYTDCDVPDFHGSEPYRKRIVEERLVYSEFFPLN